MAKPVFNDDLLAALPQIARDHALHMEDALHRKDAFSACVWAAVFLEALFEDVLEKLEATPEGRDGAARPDLGGMIETLWKKLDGNPKLRRATVEVIDCAHSVRSIRNRLVHNTGRAKTDVESAARRIADDLGVILLWWRELPGQRKPDRASPTGRVFLSTITADQPRHRGFLADVQVALEERGVVVERLILTEYDRRQPLTRAAELMRSCDAVLCIGLERTHAYYVRDREGTDREAAYVNRRYSSAWLHMEAGLAAGLGKPVFVLCESDIANEGVFDRGWNEYVVVEMKALSVHDAGVKTTIDRLIAALHARGMQGRGRVE